MIPWMHPSTTLRYGQLTGGVVDASSCQSRAQSAIAYKSDGAVGTTPYARRSASLRQTANTSDIALARVRDQESASRDVDSSARIRDRAGDAKVVQRDGDGMSRPTDQMRQRVVRHT